MKKIAFVAALSVLVLGCSSSKSSDPNVDAWTREVEVLRPGQLGERQYEELGGMLEERIMLRATYTSDEDAIREAEWNLRRRAAELDADAVVIVQCGRNVRPMNESSPPVSAVPEVVCHGVAIRWLD